MQQALALSQQALPACLPNPPVGCVLVKDGKVVAQDHTQAIGGDHAEVQAIKQCQGSLSEVTAYVISSLALLLDARPLVHRFSVLSQKLAYFQSEWKALVQGAVCGKYRDLFKNSNTLIGLSIHSLGRALQALWLRSASCQWEPPLPVRHASPEHLDGTLKACELLTQDTSA